MAWKADDARQHVLERWRNFGAFSEYAESDSVVSIAMAAIRKAAAIAGASARKGCRVI